MVRVVDTTPDPDFVKRVSCGNCGSKLEYTKSDRKPVSSKDYTGCVDVSNEIVCPTCQKGVRVP